MEIETLTMFRAFTCSKNERHEYNEHLSDQGMATMTCWEKGSKRQQTSDFKNTIFYEHLFCINGGNCTGNGI
jgi:hypothetical protein